MKEQSNEALKEQRNKEIMEQRRVGRREENRQAAIQRGIHIGGKTDR